MKPGVVFDCMVFLQGAGRPDSPARACFRLVDEDRVTRFLSPEILAEVRDVLTRPRTQRKFPLLTAAWVDAFVANASSKAVLLSAIPNTVTLARDPKDEPYLNLALAARAQYLVSRDLDLLDLMTDDGFRQCHPELAILDPVAFLRAVPGPTHSDSVPESEPEQQAEATQGQVPPPPGEEGRAEGREQPAT